MSEATPQYRSTETFWTPPSHSYPDRTLMRSQIGSRWVGMSVIAMILFAVTYIGLVRTRIGQYMENSALLGAEQLTGPEVTDALDTLKVISVTSLLVVMGAYLVAGLLRRSWRVAVAGIATLGLATVLAEVLKHFIPRPDLADIYQNNAHNSFPSGHTTIAMAILISLLLVVSYRWRGLAMLLAASWATSVGAATLQARWHRLSDTIGGDLIVLFVGALVMLWLVRTHQVRPEEGRSYPLRVIFVVGMTLVGVSSLVVGTTLGVATLSNFGVLQEIASSYSTGTPAQLTAHLDPAFNENMYLAAQSLALGFSTVAALWFWGTMHRVSTRPGA
ncbi:phosphatase PAP2 family protein [Actinomyces minihominis]|uniref:phosphatase PAP2 family protein n=1 Tax=Actinomyces minihominis TaxID=2002838 RepID=UPI000C0808E3|nr:phosphatase PAP2 family protein [Actinomyces minihominis]